MYAVVMECCLQTALLRNNRIYYVVYKIACHLVFRSVGPLLVLTVLNCCLAQSLRDAKRRRQQLTGASGSARRMSRVPVATAAVGTRAGRRASKQRRNTTTIMVVAVIFVFIVCHLPDVAMRLAGYQLQVSSVSRLKCRFKCRRSKFWTVAIVHLYVSRN